MPDMWNDESRRREAATRDRSGRIYDLGELCRLRDELVVAPEVERPIIHILVALVGQISGELLACAVIDLLHAEWWLEDPGWTVVAVDPEDREAFARWQAGR